MQAGETLVGFSPWKIWIGININSMLAFMGILIMLLTQFMHLPCRYCSEQVQKACSSSTAHAGPKSEGDVLHFKNFKLRYTHAKDMLGFKSMICIPKFIQRLWKFYGYSNFLFLHCQLRFLCWSIKDHTTLISITICFVVFHSCPRPICIICWERSGGIVGEGTSLSCNMWQWGQLWCPGLWCQNLDESQMSAAMANAIS